MNTGFRGCYNLLWAVLLISLVAPGCKREKRDLRTGAAERVIFGKTAFESSLRPGGQTGVSSNPYHGNAYAISEGQRLYQWYNCVGCHGRGGGGIGPPLMDQSWTYGGEPENIFETIVKGRPNGMPAWGPPAYRTTDLAACRLRSFHEFTAAQVRDTGALGRTRKQRRESQTGEAGAMTAMLLWGIQSALDPAGPYAGAVTKLWWLLFAICAAVFLLVIGFTAKAAFCMACHGAFTPTVRRRVGRG